MTAPATWSAGSESATLEPTPQLLRRRRAGLVFEWVCAGLTWAAIAILVVLLYQIVEKGIGWLTWEFMQNLPSRKAEKAGIGASLAGTLWLTSITAAIAIPLGVMAAIHLEEYSRKSRLNTIIEVNIANLAGVPSIVYGLLGLALFVRILNMGPSILAGACTMALLVLPVIIITAREALRAVPGSLREASLALGATRWQTTWRVVLPAAIPGILTGIILSLARAIGETAPLIVVGAVTYVSRFPRSLDDKFTVLPLQIFDWAKRPQDDFRYNVASAAIIVLLIVMFVMNGLAVWLRHRSRKKMAT